MGCCSFLFLHGFYGAVKERIRTARAPRLETPPRFWGVSEIMHGLWSSKRAQFEQPCPALETYGVLLFFVLHGFYGAVKERIRTARAPRPRNAPVGRFINSDHQTPLWVLLFFCMDFMER